MLLMSLGWVIVGYNVHKQVHSAAPAASFGTV